MGVPAEWKIYCQRLPVSVRDNIIIKDPIENPTILRQLYQCMDVFLHAANQGETFGMVLAEAMLCGIPVVSLSSPYRDNSQLEVLNYGRGGMSVRNASHMTDAILFLMQNPQKAKQLGSAGRKSIIDNYSKDVLSIKIQRIINAVLASKKLKDEREVNKSSISYKEAWSEIKRQLQLVYAWKYVFHIPFLFVLSKTREPFHGKIVYLYRLCLGHVPLRSLPHSLLKQFWKLNKLIQTNFNKI